MEIKEIKQIVEIMKRSSLTEFELQENDFKIRICRSNGEVQTVAAHHVMAPAAPAAGPAPTPAPEEAAPVDESKIIKSPMVGTFYSAPAPESPPFVKTGDKVSEDSVVCIIEAMKVMNEIKAETSGSIAEVFVENGESIEYGQPLFRLS